jgi:hypothetical protein
VDKEGSVGKGGDDICVCSSIRQADYLPFGSCRVLDGWVYCVRLWVLTVQNGPARGEARQMAWNGLDLEIGDGQP